MMSLNKICERCGKHHDGTFGSGRYCSRSCANSRGQRSPEVKSKISQSVKNSFQLRGKKFTDGFSKYYKKYGVTKKDFYTQVLSGSILDCSFKETEKRKCVMCGKEFYSRNKRKTCSDVCYTQLKIQNDEKMRTSKPWKYKQDKSWTEHAILKLYKYYFTYKTINKVTGNYYVGMHCTNTLNDGYLGSGVALKSAIKKYGKENFKRQILEYFNCYKDVSEAEKLLISSCIKDKKCYNLAEGGNGGPNFLGKHHSNETRKTLSMKAKKASNSLAHIKYNQINTEKCYYKYYMLNELVKLNGFEKVKLSFRGIYYLPNYKIFCSRVEKYCGKIN